MTAISVPASDRGDFGSRRSKVTGVLDSDHLEWDANGRPVRAFAEPASAGRAHDIPIKTLLIAAAITLIVAVAIGFWLRTLQRPECRTAPQSFSWSFDSVGLAPGRCFSAAESAALPLRREIGP